MPRRKLTSSERKKNRCFRLTDAEMKRLSDHARKTKRAQREVLSQIISTLP